MHKRRDFMAELNKGLRFPRLISLLATDVLADEGSNEGEENTTPEGTQLNYETLIAQARKEEKDKLYPRIKKLETENTALTKSTNTYLLETAALKDEIAKLKNSEKDNTVVTALETKVSELEGEITRLKSSAPNEEEIRKKIEAEYEVKMYAQEQITSNADSIISILVPEIKGATKEEIDMAIAQAKEKTLTIKKDLGLVSDDGTSTEGEGKASKKTEPKAKPRKAPAAVPTTETDEDYDQDYVRNLDPRSDEYKEFRKKMGLR